LKNSNADVADCASYDCFVLVTDALHSILAALTTSQKGKYMLLIILIILLLVFGYGGYRMGPGIGYYGGGGISIVLLIIIILLLLRVF